jgi:hypothetical protein
VLDLLQKLEDEYNAARKEKEDLESSVNKCAKQLQRAQQLINGKLFPKFQKILYQ